MTKELLSQRAERVNPDDIAAEEAAGVIRGYGCQLQPGGPIIRRGSEAQPRRERALPRLADAIDDAHLHGVTADRITDALRAQFGGKRIRPEDEPAAVAVVERLRPGRGWHRRSRPPRNGGRR
jgi:hypothetical protein